MHTKTLVAGTVALMTLSMAMPAFAHDGQDDWGESEGRDRVATTVPERVLGEKAGLIMGFQSLFRRGDDKRDEHAGAPKIELGGKVSAVSGSAFTIELPAMRDRATSTATIMTNASTTYKMKGSDTATLSDIAAGSFVQVKGLLTSTSTMTITAIRVDIASGTPRVIKERIDDVKIEVKQRIEDKIERDIGSSTSRELPKRVRDLLQTIFSRLGLFNF